MKHNTLKRTLAAGLAVLCIAAYAPTFGNTGLFDIAITVSALSWTISEDSSLKCSQTMELDADITVKDGGEFTIVDNATLTLTGSFTAESNSIIILGAASKIIANSIDFSSTNVTVPDGYAVKITDTCIKTIPQWESGDCTVTLDTDDGTLTVSGNGAMENYDHDDAPWAAYSSLIKSVVVEDGVTSIGRRSIFEFENLETITVNCDLTSTIIEFAYGCNNLKTVTFNGDVDSFIGISGREKLEAVTFNGNVGNVEAYAFAGAGSLKNVTFNGSVNSIGNLAFYYCGSLETVTLTPQEIGTLEIGEPFTDNTTAKIKYANTSGYLYDGETRIEDGTLIGDLQGKTLTWGPTYEDGIGAQLVGYSLSLDGDIGVNFYMELADEIANSQTAYMQFTIPAGSDTVKKTVPVKEAGSGTANGKTYHVFKCNVSAKDMASTIKAQIIDGNKKGTEYKYSVKDYADYLLEHNEVEEYANAATLVKKLLNYGAASQTYFGIAGTAVNAGLSDTDKVIDNVKIPEKFKYVEGNAELPAGVTFAGATLSLKSETTLSLYFEGLPDNTTFACGDKEVEPEKNGSYVVARIRGIKAKELQNDFTLTFTGGSVKYKAMTYCYNVLNGGSDDAALKNVCRALYLYAQAAKAYSE